jgi:integrase
MANRYASFRHVRFTRRSRERHAQADAGRRAPTPAAMQTQTPSQATEQENLPLSQASTAYTRRSCAQSARARRRSRTTTRRWASSRSGSRRPTAGLLPSRTSTWSRRASSWLTPWAAEVRGPSHPGWDDKGDALGHDDPSVHARPQNLRRLAGARGPRGGSPAAHAAPAAPGRTAIAALSEAEERALLGAYDDNNPTECRLKAIFLLMLDTGMRCAELTGLTLENLDLDGGFLLVMGKWRKERSIPFGFTTERLLRKYVTFFWAQPALPSVDALFLSPDGYPLTYTAVKMIFTRAAKRSGIERLHPHLLRHTFGIRAQENGMPTITLQHYMGHSSSKVTERYAHAAQSERLKRARGYPPIDQLGLRVKRVGPTSGGKRDLS